MSKFEVWGCPDGSMQTISTPENIRKLWQNQDLIGEIYLYSIVTESWELAVLRRNRMEYSRFSWLWKILYRMMGARK